MADVKVFEFKDTVHRLAAQSNQSASASKEAADKLLATAAFVKAARVIRKDPRVYGPGYNQYGPTIVVDGGFKVDMHVYLTDGMRELQLKDKGSLDPATPSAYGPPVQIPEVLRHDAGFHFYNMTPQDHQALWDAFDAVTDGRVRALQAELDEVWQDQLKAMADPLERYKKKYDRAKARQQTPEAQARKRAEKIKKRDEVFSKFFAEHAQSFGPMAPADVWAAFKLVRDIPWALQELGKTIRTNKQAAEGVESVADVEELLKLATVKSVLES